MKRGLNSYTYTQVGTLRVSIAFIFMSIIGLKHFKGLRAKDLLPLAIVGFLGNAIPYLLFPLAVIHIESSVVGIINALVPLFTVLVGGWFFGQRAGYTQWQGVAVGLLGAIILILPLDAVLRGSYAIKGELVYGLYGVLATLMYGISVNTINSQLNHIKPLALTTLSLATAGPFTLAYSLSSGVITTLQSGTQAWIDLGYIVILGVLGSGIAVILFNKLIQMTSALFSSSVTYAIPIVAVVWGVIDGEAIEWNHLAGLGIIMTGIYLVNKKKRA